MHDIEERLREEGKNLCKICETLEDKVIAKLEEGIGGVKTEELGEVVDMIKDMYEAKEKLYKTCYYKCLMKSMEEDKEGREKERERMEMEERIRSQHGAEMPMRMYYPVDVQGSRRGSGNSGGDYGQGGMYTGGDRDYDGRGGDRRGGGNSGNWNDNRRGSGMGSGMRRGSSSGSRYGFSFDNYMEARDMYTSNDPDQKKMRMDSLNEDLDDLVEMGKEVARDMTPEEKQIWKSKISKILNA